MFNKFLLIIKYTSMKESLMLVLASSFIVLMLELISLGAIAPVIYILVDIKNLDNETLVKIFHYFKIDSTSSKVLFIVTITLIIYLIKFISLTNITRFQESRVNLFLRRIEMLIFSKFLNQSYMSFVKDKSSDFIKLFQVELSFFYFFIKATLVLFSESIFLLLTLLVFFFFDPILSSIGVIIFGVVFFIKYNSSKNEINKIGVKRQQFDKEISDIIDESIRGFKEIKLEFKSTHYIDSIEEAIINKRDQVILGVVENVTPKFYFELVAIISILTFSTYFTIINEDPNLILKLGIFVAIIFKLVPSINKILISIQSIKFRKQSLIQIHLFLKKHSNQVQEKKSTLNLGEFKSLKIKDLDIKYGNNIILNKASFSINKNQKVGIFGPSGSGKSTIVNYLSGLIDSNKSNIFYNNNNKLSSIKEIRPKLGYVPQTVFISNNSLAFNIAYGAPFNYKIDEEKLLKIIHICKLSDLFTNKNELFAKKLGDSGSILSGGQKQRIGIARALYKDSEIIILDESTSALDKKTEKTILDLLYDLDKAIIFISHNKNVLKDCDMIFELKNNNLKRHK